MADVNCFYWFSFLAPLCSSTPPPPTPQKGKNLLFQQAMKDILGINATIDILQVLLERWGVLCGVGGSPKSQQKAATSIWIIYRKLDQFCPDYTLAQLPEVNGPHVSFYQRP